MTAIGIGWGITWFVYAADYTRFTRPEVSTRRLFGVTFAGMFVPVVWLGILGAYIASAGGGVDPAQLVIAAFGALALPVLLLIVHGPIATNIVVMYSSVLGVLSLDLKATQWKIAVGGGVVSSIVLWGFLHSASFANSAAAWMSALVVWISPWAAITLIDFFVLRRGHIDPDLLYRPPSPRWTDDVDWTAMACMAVGLVAGVLFMTTAIEGLQGPFAVAIGHVDLSWLAGSARRRHPLLLTQAQPKSAAAQHLNVPLRQQQGRKSHMYDWSTVDVNRLRDDRRRAIKELMTQNGLSHLLLTGFDHIRYATDYRTQIIAEAFDWFAAVVDVDGNAEIFTPWIDRTHDDPIEDLPWIKKIHAMPSWAPIVGHPETWTRGLLGSLTRREEGRCRTDRPRRPAAAGGIATHHRFHPDRARTLRRAHPQDAGGDSTSRRRQHRQLARRRSGIQGG